MAKRNEPPPPVDEVIDALKALATPKTRDGMTRYGIPNDKALGVTVGDIRGVGKRVGRHHVLAQALWDTGIYEARMLAAFVDDPSEVTPDQMDAWLADTDNWAVCDTLCFHLFDRTPHVFDRVAAWADRPEEFVKRGAFALLASAALHDKKAPDEPFAACLPLCERGAEDERNFVKKGVSWALRGVGQRSRALNAAATEVAERLVARPSRPAKWVGKDTLKELADPARRAKLKR